MKSKNIKDIAILGTIYSLFLYCLIKIEDIENTYFILGKGVPNEIYFNLKHRERVNERYLNSEISIIRMLSKIYLRLKYEIKFRNLALKFWGHDHLPFSSEVLGNNKITLIEDGIANYSENNFNAGKTTYIKKLLYPLIYGVQSTEESFGTSKMVESIIMTNLKPIPNRILHKATIINPYEIWNNLKINDKLKIYNIFNITNAELDKIHRNIILITQVCDDPENQEKYLEIYKNAISKYNNDDILIKKHPRERINYSEIFPNIQIFDKPIPLELLSLMGINFKIAMTISSTAIYNLPESTKKIFLV